MEGVPAAVDLVGPFAFLVGGIGASESVSEARSDKLRFWEGLGAVEAKADLVGAIFAVLHGYTLLAGFIS